MKRKILAVDDSSSVRKLLKFSLKTKGWEVSLAEDGQEALELLAKDRYDIIITDINMPRMDGFEFLTRVRRDAAYADTPVIILTTEGQDEDKEKAMGMGASDYIVKPFKPTQLLSLVEAFQVASV
jgi:two-component system, chemotaxis family, chemotaxis protein CheY